MKIETLRFGSLEVDPEKSFHFPVGLLGFKRLRDFVIIESEEQHPFKWMQSVEDGEVAFVLSDPLLFLPTYRLSIYRDELSLIKPEREEDLAVSVIMTIGDQGLEISANLCAPLLFNLRQRLAQQYVLSDRRYPVKYFLVREGAPAPPAPLPEPPLPLSGAERRSISLR